MDIIGIGDSGVDLVLRVPNMPDRGGKARAYEIGRTPGGMVGNFCCGVAKHGLTCGLVTQIGDDEFGKIMLEDYRARGLDLRGLQVLPGKRTFYCICCVDDSGEKRLLTVESDLLSPVLETIDFSYLLEAKYVHMNSMDRSLVESVASRLKGSQAKLSLDYEAHAQDAGLASWETALKGVSILFLNEEGMRSLMGPIAFQDAADKLLDLGIELVVLTQAEKGGCIYTPGHTYPYRAVPVEHIVDTTGAGDCFNAAFLSAIILGQSIENAAAYAATAASLSIQKVGAREGLPSRAEIEACLHIQKESRESNGST